MYLSVLKLTRIPGLQISEGVTELKHSSMFKEIRQRLIINRWRWVMDQNK